MLGSVFTLAVFVIGHVSEDIWLLTRHVHGGLVRPLVAAVYAVLPNLEREIRAVEKVLRSGRLRSGRVVEEFEKRFAGLVGARYVAQQAEPDGHTIMMYASAFTVSTLLSPGLDPKELLPLATVATIPTVLVTPPGKYKTVAEFVATAKAQPGKLVCADAGIETPKRKMSVRRKREDNRKTGTTFIRPR